MIQMKCPSCDSKLKVADKLAGRTIACPGCKQKIEVPAVESSGDEFAEVGESDDAGMPDFSELAASSASQPATASGVRSASRKQTCPMCGEKISPSAKQCPSCGESLGQGSASGLLSAPVSVSDALGRAWRLLNRNQWTVIGAFIIYCAPGILLNVANAILDGQARRAGVDRNLFVQFGSALVVNLFQSWLYLGYMQILLNTAKGKPASIGLLFSKGNLLLYWIGAAILAALAIMVGLVGLIIGAFIVAIILQPLPFVLVDQKVNPIECISKTFSLGWANFGTMLLTAVVTFGLVFAGILMCGIGATVTVPLAILMQAIIYLMMTGQPVAGEAA